ncbi:MAG: heparan-alpha-glucosaminide N-acetyltransferase [Oscillospiraceae bacterium]
MTAKKRIQLIDATRGLCVILMVGHHFLYDLVVFLGAPAWLFSNPVLNSLHYFFAGMFIFLSGVSSRFSRSNLKRGVKVFLIAMVLSIVTWFMDMPIRFGVLHLLGFCMIFYGLTYKLWESFPAAVLPIFCSVLLFLTANLAGGVVSGTKFLWMFGWTYPGFYSSDYFPIFPWLFVFIFGTWAGKYIRDGRLPAWFYSVQVPLFPTVGQKALLIYVLHQPVLYVITLFIKKLFT